MVGGLLNYKREDEIMSKKFKIFKGMRDKYVVEKCATKT